MQARHLLAAAVLASVAAAAARPAAAYVCAVTPKGDALVLKTDNPYADVTAMCTVTCRFAGPDARVETVTCEQHVPPAAKGWYVCLRPTYGKLYKPLDGSETCEKQVRPQ